MLCFVDVFSIMEMLRWRPLSGLVAWLSACAETLLSPAN
jgi:hypothetical protein